jgi:hypothetical protein
MRPTGLVRALGGLPDATQRCNFDHRKPAIWRIPVKAFSAAERSHSDIVMPASFAALERRMVGLRAEFCGILVELIQVSVDHRSLCNRYKVLVQEPASGEFLTRGHEGEPPIQPVVGEQDTRMEARDANSGTAVESD